MLTAIWNIMLQLSPWLLLGAAVSSLIHVLLPAGWIHRTMRGTWGVVKGVALGVPLPLCSCGVIPAGIGLKKDGAGDGAAVGFLISTPQTGVDSILLSASFLGWPFALFKVVSAAVTGLVGGWLAERVTPPPDADPAAPAGRSAPGHRPAETPHGRFRDGLSHGLEVVRSIWIWLIVGVVVSAAIEVYLPPAVFEQLGSWGSLPSALAALAISLPLYVCATASVPIASSLVAGGLPAGAALVFLMAGPATNVATMGAVYRAFGGRTLIVYLATIILGSVGCAVVFDELLPLGAVATHAHDHHPNAWWSVASAVGVSLLFTGFAVDEARRRFRRRGASGTDEPGYRVAVDGMTCNACVQRLETALRRTPGVEAAHVHLAPGQAVVHGAVDRQRIHEVIRATGFEPQEAVPTAAR